MSLKARLVIALVISAVMLTISAGCDGKDGGVDQPYTPNLPGQASVDLTNEDRLETADNADEFVVRGTLSVEGLTLLNTEGEPVDKAEALPELDARLLDPEEDILSAVKPTVDGAFTLRFTPPATVSRAGDPVDSNNTDNTIIGSKLYAATLVISGHVEEDLNGDGEGGDEIRQEIPLSLLLGQVVEISMELSYGDEHYVDPALLPETGWFVLTTLNALDADGVKQLNCAVFYADGTTVFDINGNNYLEFGDYSSKDEDLNGIADDFQNIDSIPATNVLALQGQITAVNSAKLTVMMRTFDGNLYTLQLQQFTPVELWDKAGMPIGNVPLGPQLIGMYASTEGPFADGAVHPYQVIVYEGF